jgi:archaemetzincin
MKIGILRIGPTDLNAATRIQERLNSIFTGSQSEVIDEQIALPEEAFDQTGKQYDSDVILKKVKDFAEKQMFDRVLGIVDVDIYVQRLNFVFGEADCPGKTALISLWRLKQEFYGRSPRNELFFQRSEKEAVHELGHTLGLQHCSNPFCVMHFSNSIHDTDVKKNFFCKKCSLEAETKMSNIGMDLEERV